MPGIVKIPWKEFGKRLSKEDQEWIEKLDSPKKERIKKLLKEEHDNLTIRLYYTEATQPKRFSLRDNQLNNNADDLIGFIESACEKSDDNEDTSVTYPSTRVHNLPSIGSADEELLPDGGDEDLEMEIVDTSATLDTGNRQSNKLVLPGYHGQQEKGPSLQQSANSSPLATQGKPINKAEFDKIVAAWQKKVEASQDQEHLFKNVTCNVKDGVTTTIVPSEKGGGVQKIEHSYEKGFPKIKMTNPPDDRTIRLFMESSKEMAPLELQTACGSEMAIKLFKASVIHGVKINLHEEDIKAIMADPKLSKEFQELQKLDEKMDGNPDLRTKFRQETENQPLDKIQFKDLLSEDLHFSSKKP